MKRNLELCIRIMKTAREAEGSMPRLSYRDFEGTTMDEFIEHCKQLGDGGLVEVRLVSGGGAHVRLTWRGNDFLDDLDRQGSRPSRKLGYWT